LPGRLEVLDHKSQVYEVSQLQLAAIHLEVALSAIVVTTLGLLEEVFDHVQLARTSFAHIRFKTLYLLNCKWQQKFFDDPSDYLVCESPVVLSKCEPSRRLRLVERSQIDVGEIFPLVFEWRLLGVWRQVAAHFNLKDGLRIELAFHCTDRILVFAVVWRIIKDENELTNSVFGVVIDPCPVRSRKIFRPAHGFNRRQRVVVLNAKEEDEADWLRG